MRLAERYWKHVDRFSTELFLFIFSCFVLSFQSKFVLPLIKNGKNCRGKKPELVSCDLSLRTKYHVILV